MSTKSLHTHACAVAALAAAAFLAPAAAFANTVTALQDGNYLVWIDTAARKVTGWVKVAGGAKLVGIDVRRQVKLDPVNDVADEREVAFDQFLLVEFA